MTVDQLTRPTPPAALDGPAATWRPTPGRRLRSRLVAPAITSTLLSLALVLDDRLPSVDGLAYFEVGRNLLSGDGYTRQGRPELHFPPLTPVSLGLLERATGSEMAALRIWNFGWGLAVVALVVALAHRLSSDDDVTVATAWVAGTASGLIPVFVRSGGGSEAPAAACLLGAVLLAIGTWEGPQQGPPAEQRARRHLRSLAGAGLLVGLAYLARPESLLTGGLIGLVALGVARRRIDPHCARRRAVLARSVAFVGALSVVVLPYVAFLHHTTGSWTPTSKSRDASVQAWQAVAEGNRLERDRILYSVSPEGKTVGRPAKSLTTLAREDPAGWLRIVRINAQRLADLLLVPRSGIGPHWPLVPVVLLPSALVLVWHRRRSRPIRVLTAMSAVPLVTCLVFFTQSRYLVMTTALVVLLGSWGLVEWSRHRRPMVRVGAWVVMSVLVASALLSDIDPTLPGRRPSDPLEQRSAGAWIDRHAPGDARVMTASFYVQAYARRTSVALPAADYPTMIRYARRMGVDYVVADGSSIAHRRPQLSRKLLGSATSSGLELMHAFAEHGHRVRIYRLDPPAPATDLPPAPLGYVSDG